MAANPKARPKDIIHPGHIFPLMAQNGGVLSRAGHTEAGCDLANLAGLTPASVICEILQDNGSMARLPELIEFSTKHQLRIGAIADLIHHRSRTESLVERVAEKIIQTIHGGFRLVAYLDKTINATHLALIKGEINPDVDTLVRVHEPLSVIDLLDLNDRTHSWSINDTLRVISDAGCGVVVLLHSRESPMELIERVTKKKTEPHISTRTDLRNYGIGAQILKDLGVGKMRLLAVPRKMPSMKGFGLKVMGYLGPESVEQS
jgi:3,4-dihydroxy 2-butanone 4-phosphate synthase/GTP cyclohydrolase II